MTLQKTHSFRQINLVVVIAVAALIAAACGGDDTAVMEPVTTTTTTPSATTAAPTSTTTTVEPSEAREEAIITIISVFEDAATEGTPSFEECRLLVNGEPGELTDEQIEACWVTLSAVWDACVALDCAELGLMPEHPTTTTEAPVTTTSTVVVTEKQPTETQDHADEGAAVYEIGEVVSARELVQDESLPDDLLCEILENDAPTCWIEPEPLVTPEPEPEAEIPQPEPEQVDDSAEQVPEPEQLEPEQVDDSAEQVPEPEQLEPEQVDDSAEQVPEPEQLEPEETLPEYQVGDMVQARELFQDESLPDNLVCEIQEDGHPTCWTETPESDHASDEWVPPVAGVVPEPAPECSSDTPTWDETCTPPNSWNWGEFEIGGRVDETPRLTTTVVDFWSVCNSTAEAPCEWLAGLMKWPLDYLGARPSCMLGEYLDRIEAGSRAGLYVGDIANVHGWHNCATVIDPLVGEVPEDGTDVGLRLSDTGMSLAERCRAVLPEDVMLETGYKLSGTPPTRFAPGHAGCDDWAEYVEDRLASRFSYFPDCYRSWRLASEWMEHHYGVDERYNGGSGC